MFRGTKKTRNSVPNPSAEEKIARNSVPWNQNRYKFSEFRSEPFCGRGHNSEFLSVQHKIEINSRNAVPNHSVEEKPTSIFKRLWSPEIDSKELIPSASLCSLAGRYDNHIPPRFLAPIGFLKIPAQNKTRQPNISIIVSEKTTFNVIQCMRSRLA